MTSPAPARRPARLKRRWLPWALVIGVLLAWTMAVLIALAVIRADQTADEDEVTIDDGRVAVELTVPRGVRIDSITSDVVDETCPMLSYALAGDTRQPELQLEFPSADCRLDEDSNQQLINGNHGVYRTIADVADPVNVKKLDTDLGPATIFDQEYVEYTNERTAFVEPVAIIELAEPASPDYPMLVIRGFTDDLTREQLEEIVGSAELPD